MSNENTNIDGTAIPTPRGIRPDTGPSVTRGVGELASSYCVRMGNTLDFLVRKSEVSFRWYTHTNPAGCWICDTFVAAYGLLRELTKLSYEMEQTRENLPGGPGESGEGIQRIQEQSDDGIP